MSRRYEMIKSDYNSLAHDLLTTRKNVQKTVGKRDEMMIRVGK